MSNRIKEITRTRPADTIKALQRFGDLSLCIFIGVHSQKY